MYTLICRFKTLFIKNNLILFISFHLVYDVTHLVVAELGLHVVAFARGGTCLGVANPRSGGDSPVARLAALRPSAPRHVVAASLFGCLVFS